MDIFKIIETRRSIRKYKPNSIPAEKLKKIFETARLAPSSGNRQPWRFVVVHKEKRKRALAEVAKNQSFLMDAAVIVAAIGDPTASERWHEKDVMIAVEHMVLAASALGYGTCWIGAFDEEKVKSLLKIPSDHRAVALLPIGVPNESPQPKPRKEISELFFEEEYGKPLR